MTKLTPLADAKKLPIWQRPFTLLMLMAIAMPLAFSVWLALLNNFVIEVANFDGVDIGWLQTVREIPGFFAIAVIFLLYLFREQTLGLISLGLLGLGTAITAWFPSFAGLLITTLIGSIGFHYYETVNKSLQLQWLTKDEAPRKMGILVGSGAGASLVAYGLLVSGWRYFEWSYNSVYMVAGAATIIIAVYCYLAFPKIEEPEAQHRKMILRKRYWLYYALQFMSGARRQIFVVFAAFMMVERFGLDVHQLTALFLINYLASMLFAPIMGRVIQRFGERKALVFEYIGLIGVFLAYGGIYWFGWGVVLACVLYVLDHMFFAMAFGMHTYFQKIADPKDIAPTAAVAFTINHIAAVFLPALLGYVWITSPDMVFILAAGMSATSLALAMLIPRHPAPGNETTLSQRGGVIIGAE